MSFSSSHLIYSTLSKYNASESKLNLFKINDLLHNRNKKYVSLFKDHLLYDDITEFLFLFFKSYTSRTYLSHSIINEKSNSPQKCFIDTRINNIMKKNKQMHKIYNNIQHKKVSPHPSINIGHYVENKDEDETVYLSFANEYSKEIIKYPINTDTSSFYSFSSERSKKTNSNTDATSNNSKENEERESKAKIISIYTNVIPPTSIIAYNNNKKPIVKTISSLAYRNKFRPIMISNIGNRNTNNRYKPFITNISSSYTNKSVTTVPSKSKHIQRTLNRMVTSYNKKKDIHIKNNLTISMNSRKTMKDTFSSKSSEKKINGLSVSMNKKEMKCFSMKSAIYNKIMKKDEKKINKSVGLIQNINKSKPKTIIPNYCYIKKQTTNRNRLIKTVV